MADRRPPGFNVPLGFYDGPEVESIPRRIRAAAVGVWTLCGTFSANKLQDGYVGQATLKQLCCTEAIRAALQATLGPDGESDPLWIDARNGGIQFTKWVKYQRSRLEVKAYREADAERKRREREGQRNGHANGETSVNGETSDWTSEGRPPDVPVESQTPKTKPKPDTGSGYVTGERHQAADPDPNDPPPKICSRHPNGNPTDRPCRECQAIREADEHQQQQQLTTRSQTLKAFWAEVRACPDCDEKGRIDADTGNRVERCSEHDWGLINA